MKKTYNYNEFKKDPRTSGPNGLSRANKTLFDCIDNKKTTPEEISSAIEKAYSIGRHRSPSYVKCQIKLALKLFKKFTF